ncbi:MAG TPA: sigma 54-interacting transcriptional regulator, partial [Candidatus Acidoferrum sp.]|nr:sigma 54-interacting transcriptional regulator [Candidatus Acidoferrum sp.]
MEVNGLRPGALPVVGQVAATEERNLLAREVHDMLKHDLAGMLPPLDGQPGLQDVDLQGAVVDARAFGDLVGQSSGLRRLASQIDVVAPTEASVLILGETGTGKELVAHE